MPTQEEVIKKFGKAFVANDDTYHMGIHQDFADHVAKRFEGKKVVLDACVGGGFTMIALAKYVPKVIAVDISPTNLGQARANAKIAGIEKNVECVEGDVLEVISQFTFDAAFLDPDWAPPGQGKTIHARTLEGMSPALDVLFDKVSQKTKDICIRLPKEFDLAELTKLPPCEIECFKKGEDLKFYCVFFGGLMKKVGQSEYRI